MKKFSGIAIFIIGLLFVKNAAAFTMGLDGKLDEWGVTPDIYGSSQWTPVNGVASNVEDTPPSQYKVDPGYGGQAFDVEAIYVTADSANLYFAVVTGFSPGGALGYSAGDIAFDFGKNGSYDFGLAAVTQNGFVSGNLYGSPTWHNGFWGGVDPASDPNYMLTGTLVPSSGAQSIYTDGHYEGANYITHYNGNHYVIEGFVPNTAFGNYWGYGKDVRMHWAMSCSNDYLNVDYTLTPEPATMALLGLGLMGLLGLKKKRR